MPKFEVYALAVEMGVWDVDAWLATVSHAQLVEWWAYRYVRTERATLLAKDQLILPPYR